MLNSNFSRKPLLLEQLICLKLSMYLFVLLTWGHTIHSPLMLSNLYACINQWAANRGQTGYNSFTYAFFFHGQKIMEMSSYFMPLKVPSFFCHLWKMSWVMIISKIFSELFTILSIEKLWTLLSSPVLGMKVTKETTVYNRSFSPFTPLRDLNVWRLCKSWRSPSPVREPKTNKKAMCPAPTSRNDSVNEELQDCYCTFPGPSETQIRVCWTKMLLETPLVGLLEL